jgi:hypothetical protein
MFASSANISTFASLIFIGRLFMYNKNNIGPRIEPYATSCLISFKVEAFFLWPCHSWLPTAAARVRVRAACGVCGSVSPANHSTDFSIIIITQG